MEQVVLFLLGAARATGSGTDEQGYTANNDSFRQVRAHGRQMPENILEVKKPHKAPARLLLGSSRFAASGSS